MESIERHKSTERSNGTVPDIPRSEQTILLIDDDPALRETMRSTLLGEGYPVVEAADSAAARTFIEGHHPSLIVSDIFMPGGDGLELLNWLQATGRAIPVIVVSGSARHLEINFLEIATKLGAVAVLEKPFRRSDLMQLVEQSLGQAG